MGVSALDPVDGDGGEQAIRAGTTCSLFRTPELFTSMRSGEDAAHVGQASPPSHTIAPEPRALTPAGAGLRWAVGRLRSRDADSGCGEGAAESMRTKYFVDNVNV